LNLRFYPDQINLFPVPFGSGKSGFLLKFPVFFAININVNHWQYMCNFMVSFINFMVIYFLKFTTGRVIPKYGGNTARYRFEDVLDVAARL